MHTFHSACSTAALLAVSLGLAGAIFAPARVYAETKGAEGTTAGRGENAAATTWKSGDTVETKWGTNWRKAVIRKAERGWYEIGYENGLLEWVEGWRVRRVGDESYDLPYCAPKASFRVKETAPDRDPGPKPQADLRVSASAEPRADAGYKPAVMKGQVISLDVPSGSWSLRPVAPASGLGLEKAMELPVTRSGCPESIVFTGGARGAVAVSLQGEDESQPLVVQKIVDGKVAGRWSFAGQFSLASLSPSGKLVALRNRHAGATRMEVWSIEQEQAVRRLLFTPYASEAAAGKVVSARLLGDDRLLTTSSGGQMVVWNIATAQAVYQATVRPGSVAAVSPGGEYIAVSGSDGVCVLAAADGKVVGGIRGTIGHATLLSFNETGTWLVAGDGWNIWAVDLKKGRLTRDFTPPLQNHAFTRLQAVGDGFAIVDGTTLVDSESRLPFASYEAPADALVSSGPDGRLWYVLASGNSATLAATNLPAEQIKRVRGTNADDVLVLRPGSSISIVMQATLSEVEQRQVNERLLEECAAQGLKVASDGSPLRLVVSTEAGKAEKRSYRRFNTVPWDPSGLETVTLTPQVSRMRLQYEGQTLWDVSASMDPVFSLQMKPGQSVQDALSEATKPDISIFTQTPMPAYMARLPSDDFVARFRLEAEGAKPASLVADKAAPQ